MMEMEFNNGYVVTCFAKANQLLLLLNFTKHAPMSLFLLFLIRKRIETHHFRLLLCSLTVFVVFLKKIHI
jgi:hypothetical protein